jgi:hypothetical protein
MGSPITDASVAVAPGDPGDLLVAAKESWAESAVEAGLEEEANNGDGGGGSEGVVLGDDVKGGRRVRPVESEGG